MFRGKLLPIFRCARLRFFFTTYGIMSCWYGRQGFWELQLGTTCTVRRKLKYLLLFRSYIGYMKASPCYVCTYIACIFYVGFLAPLSQLRKIYEYIVECKTVGFGLEIEEKVAVVYFNYRIIRIFTLTLWCKYLCLQYKIHTCIWEYIEHHNKQLTLPVLIFTVASLRTPQNPEMWSPH
jgi:hypothetical protein